MIIGGKQLSEALVRSTRKDLSGEDSEHVFANDSSIAEMLTLAGCWDLPLKELPPGSWSPNAIVAL